MDQGLFYDHRRWIKSFHSHNSVRWVPQPLLLHLQTRELKLSKVKNLPTWPTGPVGRARCGVQSRQAGCRLCSDVTCNLASVGPGVAPCLAPGKEIGGHSVNE